MIKKTIKQYSFLVFTLLSVNTTAIAVDNQQDNLGVQAVINTQETNTTANQSNHSLHGMLNQVKTEWAEIKYLVAKEQKVKQLENLITRMDQIIAMHPNDAEPLLWKGTMLSTLASLKSGLGALSTAKQARTYLETSLMKDASAENGYAHVILGALYAKVPGKPIGFGNKESAKRHFLTAINIDPEGLESNYFYGEFLMHEGQTAQAQHHFEVAQRAIPNPNFPVFEKGRRQELAQAMQTLRQKSNKA